MGTKQNTANLVQESSLVEKIWKLEYHTQQIFIILYRDLLINIQSEGFAVDWVLGVFVEENEWKVTTKQF